MTDLSILDGTGTLQTIRAPNANGQATMLLSSPVVIASDQTAIPISGTITANLAAGSNIIGAVTQSGTWSVGITGSVAATQSGTWNVNISNASLAVNSTQVAASSAARLLSSAATTNATSVKASSGTIRSIQGYNNKASAVYLKLYNKASAPTVGTDTPVKTIYLPASSAFALDFSFTFATGIAYALTGAAADADTTALASGDIVCLNIDYI